MKKTRLSLSKLDIPALIELGKRINTEMTGNANFTTPPADLAGALANALLLETAYNLSKATNSKQDWAATRVHKAALNVNLRALASYIDEVAKGNESIILSAGVAVSKKGQRLPAPEAVNSVNALFTDKPGKILLLWSMARYAHFYEVFMSTTPDKEDSWLLVNTIKGRKLMVENLATGTRYWFRVVAKGLGTEAAAPSESADQLAA